LFKVPQLVKAEAIKMNQNFDIIDWNEESDEDSGIDLIEDSDEDSEIYDLNEDSDEDSGITDWTEESDEENEPPNALRGFEIDDDFMLDLAQYLIDDSIPIFAIPLEDLDDEDDFVMNQVEVVILDN
jgi:hypothetical protein